MGFGDPYHKHPLSPSYVNRNTIKADCFHCEFPIDDERCYRCERCNFYIHEFCGNLPETMRHPLHHQHPLSLLTLFASSSSDAPTSNLCNKCQKPCLEGFAYYCHTCQFILHVKCCFTLNHEKHHHPLHFNDLGGFIFKQTTRNCNICGYPINKFSFACWGCSFFIHYDCSIIPPTIKHHHTHDLAIRYDFPKECDQVYCDMCEDRDGKLDRTLSYYYCKECDYIAHVLCVTQPKEDTMLFKHFTHEHPLRFATKDLLRCNQCDYSVKTLSREYPSSIKHPRHLEHNLTYVEGKCLYKCTDCEFTFTSSINSTFIFTHPYYRDLCFCTETSPFRCNACGELGKGSRMNSYRDFDLHLECFALPGKLEHESHPCHTLYLSLNPAEDSLHTLSPSQYCNVCTKETFGSPWKTSIYCCLDCDYVSHLACVANELLSTLRSSVKNEPGFCAIVEPDEKTFELHLEQSVPYLFPRPLEPLLRKLVKSKEDDDDAKRSAGGPSSFGSSCFHCQRPMNDSWTYGCRHCNFFYIHAFFNTFQFLDDIITVQFVQRIVESLSKVTPTTIRFQSASFHETQSKVQESEQLNPTLTTKTCTFISQNIVTILRLRLVARFSKLHQTQHKPLSPVTQYLIPKMICILLNDFSS